MISIGFATRLDQIRILNPRHRDRKKFEIIVQSIKNLGLKKPIQVSLRSKNEEGGPGYDLVCGQGRIEAFIALGYKEIPAEVVEVSKEDRLLRSLIENLARRFPVTMDLIREIERLKAQGYSHVEIGKKLDISKGTIRGLLVLKKAGEERLVMAAIMGRIPITVAIEIARAQTVEAQRALLKAYENKQLNYVSIRAVKRLIDQRRFFGTKFNQTGRNPRKTTAENLVKILKRENERQKLLIRKAKVCEAKLVFIVTAFDKLLADKSFMPLLQAESLDTMPKHLWSKLTKKLKEAA
jgi:ParB family transcriptional regulator, chromosome partitioning protein